MEPDFIALFGFQDLMQIQSAKKAILDITKAYVDKKEMQSFDAVVEVVESIYLKSDLRQEILDFIVF